MEIEKNIQNGCAELKLSGWLDTQTAPELEKELAELPADVSALVFNCSELEYISSAGLRQLVAAYKKMNGAMTLRAVSDEIMSVIKMTGLDKRLKIE